MRYLDKDCDGTVPTAGASAMRMVQACLKHSQMPSAILLLCSCANHGTSQSLLVTPSTSWARSGRSTKSNPLIQGQCQAPEVGAQPSISGRLWVAAPKTPGSVLLEPSMIQGSAEVAGGGGPSEDHGEGMRLAPCMHVHSPVWAAVPALLCLRYSAAHATGLVR